MAGIYIVKPDSKKDKFGTVQVDTASRWKVVFYCDCAKHYPTSSKETIELINNQFEGINEFETVWIEQCKCTMDCTTDIEVGYFAYLLNKYWKIVGTKLYNDCNCPTLKLTLNRLTPRESHRSMIECINCFDCKEVTK